MGRGAPPQQPASAGWGTPGDPQPVRPMGSPPEPPRAAEADPAASGPDRQHGSGWGDGPPLTPPVAGNGGRTGVPVPGTDGSALVAPVRGEPTVEQGTEPAVVAPQENPRARRTIVQSEPSRKLQPGDLVCGDCGEANLPTRKFCSRCGTSLADAETVKERWWRRLLPKHKPRRVDETVTARNATPQRRQHKRRILPVIRRTVAVVILVAGVVYAAVPTVREIVDPRVLALRDWATHLFIPEYVPVRAIKVTSPAPEDRKHPVAHVSDTFFNTYWLTPVKGLKVVELEFQEPAEPKQVIIRGGIKDDLKGSQRPRTVHVVWPTGKAQDVVLSDNTDPQTFELDSGGPVTSVEFFVQDTYQSVESDQVAVTEIELFMEKKN